MSCSGLVILCVYFHCYRVANSCTVLSLSCFLIVLMFFSSYSFFLFTARKTISTAIMWKIFLYQVYTNLAYVPPRNRRVKQLQFIMINKNQHKYLASRNGNEIIIWIWNKPMGELYQNQWVRPQQQWERQQRKNKEKLKRHIQVPEQTRQ